ncbi:MAG: hypothetical protein JSS74_08295 [Actinobacteria bacterium]|nr:hypothetical protein [Actinomycetota bacterium]
MLEFARLLETLEPHLPISDAFEKDVPQRQGTWWSSQREHMVHWFTAQASLGSGAYTRSQPNFSARTTYNRLLAPAALLWIAEGLGEDAELVRSAADRARTELNARRRPGLVRSFLPWARIAPLAHELRHTSHSR